MCLKLCVFRRCDVTTICFKASSHTFAVRMWPIMAAFSKMFRVCQVAFAQHEFTWGLLFFPPLMSDVFRVHGSKMNRENRWKVKESERKEKPRFSLCSWFTGLDAVSVWVQTLINYLFCSFSLKKKAICERPKSHCGSRVQWGELQRGGSFKQTQSDLCLCDALYRGELVEVILLI